MSRRCVKSEVSECYVGTLLDLLVRLLDLLARSFCKVFKSWAVAEIVLPGYDVYVAAVVLEYVGMRAFELSAHVKQPVYLDITFTYCLTLAKLGWLPQRGWVCGGT